MNYKVIITTDAENDLECSIRYLLEVKKSRQAAKNVLNDFMITVKNLENVAGSLRYCEHPKLSEFGYKRINFVSHRYFMSFRLDGNVAIVDKIFHELQDYESKIK